MRLTVTDTKEQPIYQKEDFLPHFKPQDITIVRVAENKNFDGSIIREVPSDTTHLLMRYMDRINKKDLERLPNLKYVGITSTGWWDMYFDRKALEERKIVVTNNPDYATNAVAEAVFATLLAERRKLVTLPLGKATTEVLQGGELAGKTLGILGMGRIGSRVAEIALGFKMRVVSPTSKKKAGVGNVIEETFYKESDVISLHVPKSAGLIISRQKFGLLKPTVVIVNSAGFNLIDIEALVDFLKENKQASYMDLSYPEGEAFAKLSTCKNAYLYPLFSNQTKEAYVNKKLVPIQNLFNFLRGEGEINRVI